MSECNCALCIKGRRIQDVLSREDVAELKAMVNELANDYLHESFDNDLNQCILNGSWDSSVEILEAALVKAKAIRGTTTSISTSCVDDLEECNCAALADMGLTSPSCSCGGTCPCHKR